MTSYAIDFALKSITSLSKWTLLKGINVLASRAATRAIDEALSTTRETLQKNDYEILHQAVEVLESDIERVAAMITKQARATLKASYSHAQRGLVIIYVSKFYQSFLKDKFRDQIIYFRRVSKVKIRALRHCLIFH